jgi:hypothetical protein
VRMGTMSGISRKHAHTNLLSISYSGNPFLSLSPAGAYPAYGSLTFTFRTCSEIQTAQAGPNADLSTEGGLAADTLQFTGHNRGVPDSVSGRPKRPRMLSTRNSVPDP